MADPTKRHERDHITAIRGYKKGVETLYEDTLAVIAAIIAAWSPPPGPFRLDNNPGLQAQIEQALDDLRERLDTGMKEAVRLEWERSMAKNIAIGIAIYGPAAYAILDLILSEGNQEAFQKFVTRKVGRPGNRLNLSGRVWNLRNGLQREIETALFAGIAEGKEKAALAREMQKYLNDPGRAFRKVRDAEGVLRLSKPAMSYHPGQGVYRSSLKNALRLVTHETNRALRIADHEKWNVAPFVLGFRTVLSPKHPRYDICDVLADLTFPVDFNWEGWHINCLCSAEPVYADNDKFREWVVAQAEGERYQFTGKVTEMPGRFEQYVENNRATFSRWKSQPIFLQNNPQLKKA